MHWYPDMMRWGWGWGFGMMLFWAFIIVLIVILVRSMSSRSNEINKKQEKPLDILKRRYASGEIDKAKYEEMKKDIEA